VNLGTFVLGTINGLLAGMLAVGVVLVYRSSKFLNLAHGQLGALPALLLAKLVIDEGWSYWPALVVCVGVGIVTGVLIERLFVEKLRKKTSSTTSFLLLTLGITELLTALVFIKAFEPNQVELIGHGYPVPVHVHLTVGGVVLGGQHVMILVICPILVGALALVLRFSTLGKMIRAAASNHDSARLCGISPTLVSGITWGVAGGLSAVTAVLLSPSQAGQFSASTLGPDLLFLALGAAAFGAFVSIPLALLGGLVIGLAQQVTLSVTSNGGTGTLVVFIVILGVVLVRGRAIAAAFATGGAASEDRPPVRVPPAIAERLFVRSRQRFVVGAGLFTAVILPFLPGLRSEGHRFQLSLVVIYAIVAVSITMLIGWGGQLSLGHFGVVGLGAFLTARLATHGWTIVPLLVAAGAIGAAVMVMIGLPALRVRGLTLAVTSLGFAVVASEWLFHVSWFTASPGAVITVPAIPLLRGLGRPQGHLAVYFLAVVVLAVVALVTSRLRHTTPGRAMIAVRDSEHVASAHAITPATTKLATLALSGSIAAMAGVLWADAWRTVAYNQFSPDLSLAMLTAPVIGGLGSIGGAIAGAAALYLPTYFISPHIAGLFGRTGSELAFQLALGGLGIIGVLLSYPTGIAGAAQAGWERLLRRVESEVPVRTAATVHVAEHPALEVRDVTLNFGGLRALDSISLRVHPGEIVGLIGSNGAGKSTLINVICGLLRPDSGGVWLSGTDISHLPPEVRAGVGLGRTFQSAELFPGLTVRETIEAVIGSRAAIGFIGSMLSSPWTRRAERAGAETATTLLESVGLTAWQHTLCGDLSTGTSRICDLALQLAGRAEVLLLDEPTAGVAQRETEAFGPLLRGIRDDLGCAMVIVEHDIGLLMGICDRIYAMETGRVISEGTPEEIRADPAVIASYLGTDEVSIARSGKVSTASAPRPRPRRPARGEA